MKACRFLPALLSLGSALGAVDVPKGTAPKFTGAALPAPPSQTAPWTPPAAAPEKWSAAARVLFAQGFADPRGCEYREIEVVAGEMWPGAGVKIKTRGWVLPKRPEATQDFAIGWNGLVYPVLTVGAPGDFRADARGIGDRGDKEFFRRDVSEVGALRGETQKPARTLGPPLKVCLLLRLGELDLARTLVLSEIRAKQKQEEKTKMPVIDETDDPYLAWASQWLWAQWDRAVCAHMRGDDRLALATLRPLAAVQPAISDETARRSFPHEKTYDPDEERVAWPHFNWLREPLPLLLADQERRAKSTPRPTVVEAGAEKYPDQTARITALIEDLQEVAVRQMAQPGGLESYEFDPIVEALIKEGETAIEPLFAAWETDGKRLTRSVSYHRDFFPSRNLHRVSEPIVAALAAIMKVSTDDFRTLPGGVTPATVRAYWQKIRGTTLAERWYRIFADDTAGVDAWLQAGREIVRPRNLRNLGNGSWTITPLKPGEMAGMAGETLRAKVNPTLPESWVKRVPAVNAAFGLNDASDFLACLARWDVLAARPLLAAQMRLCLQDAEHRDGMFIGRGRRLFDFVARFTLLRAEGGDLAALDEFCTWLATRGNRKDGEFFDPRGWSARPWNMEDNVRVFEPLWRFPDHPAVKAAVHKLFDEPDSPLLPLLDLRDSRGVLEHFTATPMCRFPEMRSALIRALADTARHGVARAQKDGLRKIGNATFISQAPDADVQLETDVAYRVCDFFAWQLTRWTGFPPIELTWPEEKRDAAVAECLRLLRKPGDLFEKNLPGRIPSDPPELPEEFRSFP